MIRVLTWLFAAASLLPAVVYADSNPARGKLLVATEAVQGELFANTVVLLLYYDETGAFGLVVNRPTDVPLAEVLGEEEAIAAYRGTLFWGGPVHMDSLRALLVTDSPPADAEKIVESVYLVSYEDAFEAGAADTSRMRLFIGYAGWAPGQLERELAHGSSGHTRRLCPGRLLCGSRCRKEVHRGNCPRAHRSRSHRGGSAV